MHISRDSVADLTPKAPETPSKRHQTGKRQSPRAPSSTSGIQAPRQYVTAAPLFHRQTRCISAYLVYLAPLATFSRCSAVSQPRLSCLPFVKSARLCPLAPSRPGNSGSSVGGSFCSQFSTSLLSTSRSSPPLSTQHTVRCTLTVHTHDNRTFLFLRQLSRPPPQSHDLRFPLIFPASLISMSPVRPHIL